MGNETHSRETRLQVARLRPSLRRVLPDGFSSRAWVVGRADLHVRADPKTDVLTWRELWLRRWRRRRLARRERFREQREAGRKLWRRVPDSDVDLVDHLFNGLPGQSWLGNDPPGSPQRPF